MTISNVWLPIETIPKDGTRVLVFGGLVYQVEIAYAFKDGEVVCELGEDRRIPSDPPCDATHWMPLPSAPKFLRGE